MSVPTTTPQQLLTASHEVGEQRIVIDGVSWDTYERLLVEIENRGIRLTYDRGRLEMTSRSLLHEKYKRLLGRIIETLAEELDLPLNSGCSTTLRQREMNRGLEADECYWLQNAVAVLGKRDLDFAVDPPPDLAIEVDITSSCLDKLAVYAALRVPEVWRYNGESLRVSALQGDGTYAECDRSCNFPGVPLATLVRFLERWDELNETALIKEFRRWVSEHVKT